MKTKNKCIEYWEPESAEYQMLHTVFPVFTLSKNERIMIHVLHSLQISIIIDRLNLQINLKMKGVMDHAIHAYCDLYYQRLYRRNGGNDGCWNYELDEP